MEHLDDYQLGLFVTGKLSEEEEDLIELHLSECEECHSRLDRVEQLRFQIDPFIHEIKLAANIVPIKELTAERLLGNNFLLKNKIGQGGMGVVWKAFDRLGNRQVVLKFILPNSFCFDEATQTYRETFQKIHMLHHSNICPLYGLYEDSEYGLYLAMKYIDGETLSAYRKRKGILPLDEVVKILRYVAEGLDYSHAHKVVHNDIKPQNIMISKSDGVQIIDFDLADAIHDTISSQIKLAEKKIAGTRVYMAPEQWEGTTCLQSDQYALAVTAYELLSGSVPFKGKDIDVLSHAVRNYPPPYLKELPDYVNTVLQRGLAKDPTQRYSSCTDFVLALEGKLIQEEAVTSIPVINGNTFDLPNSMILEDIEKPKNTNWFLPLIILTAVTASLFLLAWVIFIMVNNYPELKKRFWSDPSQPSRPITEQTENLPITGNSPQGPTIPSKQPLPVNKPISNTKEKNLPAISLPPRETSLPSIRFLINIDEKGIVTFNAQRSNTIVPFPKITGTSFPFNALQVGLGICGSKPSNNRVVFPYGQIGPPISRSEKPFLNQTSFFGWKFQANGLAQSSSPFPLYKERPGIVSPGTRLAKNLKLPVTFFYEIIDDALFSPPLLSISIGKVSGFNRCNLRFRGSRDQNGLITFSGSIDGALFNSTASFRNVKLDKDNMLSQRIIIPSETLYGPPYQRNESNPYFETAFDLRVSTSIKGNGQFTLSYLEIIGDFEGNIGVPRLDQVIDNLIVQKIHNALINTIPHSNGTKITGINGTSNPKEINAILNSLKFGEKVTLDITEDKGRSSSTPSKRNVSIYAQ